MIDLNDNVDRPLATVTEGRLRKDAALLLVTSESRLSLPESSSYATMSKLIVPVVVPLKISFVPS